MGWMHPCTSNGHDRTTMFHPILSFPSHPTLLVFLCSLSHGWKEERGSRPLCTKEGNHPPKKIKTTNENGTMADGRDRTDPADENDASVKQETHETPYHERTKQCTVNGNSMEHPSHETERGERNEKGRRTRPFANTNASDAKWTTSATVDRPRHVRANGSGRRETRERNGWERLRRGRPPDDRHPMHRKRTHRHERRPNLVHLFRRMGSIPTRPRRLPRRPWSFICYPTRRTRTTLSSRCANFNK